MHSEPAQGRLLPKRVQKRERIVISFGKLARWHALFTFGLWRTGKTKGLFMKNLASLLAASLSILGLSSSASALTVCNIGDSQLAAVEPNWGPVTDCACGKIEAVMIGQTDGNRGTYVMISSNGWNGGGGSAWAVSQWMVSGQGTSWIYQKDVNGAYIKGNAGAGWGGGEFFAYGFDSEWLERYTLYCAQ